MPLNRLLTLVSLLCACGMINTAIAQPSPAPSALADRSGPPAPVVEATVTDVSAAPASAPGGNQPVAEKAGATSSTVAAGARPDSADSKVADTTNADADKSAKPRILRGNDQVIAKPRPPSANIRPLREKALTLKFEQAPIADVLVAVLEDAAGADYVIHPPLAGTITLSTQGSISTDQALLVLESVLQANGILMARDTRGVYHIGKPESLKGIVSAPRRVGSGPLPAGFGSVVVPLSYIGAAEMAEILRPVATPDAFLRVDTLRNLLVLAGTRSQVEGWMEIVNTFDVDLLKGMSVGVFPLKYATVREVDTALRLMTSGGGGTAAAEGAKAGAPGNAASTAALSEAHPLYGALRVMPIERLNSILVVTPRAAYLDQAREWIERLDQPGSGETEARLYVYPVQNGSASHLATVLNGIFGTGQSAGTKTDSGVARGQRAVSATSSGFGVSGLSSSGASRSSLLGTSTSGAGALGTTTGALSGSTGAAQTPAVTAIASGNGIRVIADELNNAILVWGTASDYTKIESTLKRLDVSPTQVLIEASIIEVTLKDDLRYGLQWYFQDHLANGYSGKGVLSTTGGGVLGGALAGFSYSISNPLGDIRAVLNALAEKSLVKVISSPSLMVLDNHTASIIVGDQQPVKTATTVGDNTTTESIQYKDTGVALAVTPSVNAGNVVTMQVDQSVTDVGEQIDTATGQRAFLQRQISSKVAVRSGETLVLGGLIRDNTTNGKSGVPLLHDIPVLGNLFGSTANSSARTELLVVITPRVVRSDQEMRDVSEEFRARMKGLKGFGQSSEAPTDDILPPAKSVP
ncbi:type II secretion system secretin GspD [Azoarcus sp. L1K30]|uniref:type II secretion system secretin GspD n=1 Tax=Azoarcus sp. L1K30 TaxID=2820277 RepID=UPI001B826E95|nr:type II secretion system secretin GspD [Azoarcus sp. L1K30]MBR0567243.1 type II secretion system secretin GspD [Azoarcus sp. L1K30]